MIFIIVYLVINEFNLVINQKIEVNLQSDSHRANFLLPLQKYFVYLNDKNRGFLFLSK